MTAYNASDPIDVAAAGKATDWRKQSDLAAMALVLSSQSGQRVLGLILKECHLYESSLASDPLVMAKLEGERHIGLKVRAYIEAVKPGAYDDLNHAISETKAKEEAEAAQLLTVSRERQRVPVGVRVEGSPG